MKKCKRCKTVPVMPGHKVCEDCFNPAYGWVLA